MQVATLIDTDPIVQLLRDKLGEVEVNGKLKDAQYRKHVEKMSIKKL